MFLKMSLKSVYPFGPLKLKQLTNILSQQHIIISIPVDSRNTYYSVWVYHNLFINQISTICIHLRIFIFNVAPLKLTSDYPSFEFINLKSVLILGFFALVSFDSTKIRKIEVVIFCIINICEEKNATDYKS